MKFTPLPVQKIMFEHMQKCPDSLIFASAGLSKTAAVLWHLSDLFLSADAVGALIVSTLRISTLTWPAEIHDWQEFSWMTIHSLRTKEGRQSFLDGQGAHLWTINFESLHVLVDLVEKRGGTVPYDCLVVDEITKASNHSGKRINLFRKKVPRVSRHIGLTGTPIRSSYLDLWGQTRLIDNGKRLGTNFFQYRGRYFHQESAYQFAPYVPNNGATEKIEAAIADITCTLRSEDYGDVPDYVVEDVEMKFSDDLAKQYKTLEKKLILELPKETINVANAATLIGKLQQFCAGQAYSDDDEAHWVHDMKIKKLREIVNKVGEPVLVARIFRFEEDALRKEFPEMRFFSDAKSDESQRKLLADWNAGVIPLLCGHPASCGHGLNLQKPSRTLIFLSLPFSRELYIQMIARLARRGQRSLVTVYRLMIQSSVDYAVSTSLESKETHERRLVGALKMLEQYHHKSK